MRNEFEQSAFNKSPKAKWVKPAVRQLRAGAAEVNTGAVDDGDPGSALNNS
jgi:hypothetical protein